MSETETQKKLNAAAKIYDETLKRLKSEDESQKCPLDEVAAAYIAALRVENYADLPFEFGGYKIGAIYSYVLSVLNECITDPTNAPEICEDKAFFSEKVGI